MAARSLRTALRFFLATLAALVLIRAPAETRWLGDFLREYERAASAADGVPVTSALLSPMPNVVDNSSHAHLLQPPDASLPPISFGACCGLGHRLARNMLTVLRGVSTRRPVIAAWREQGNGLPNRERVPWSAFFDDTLWIREGPKSKDFYWNGYPKDWAANLTLPRSGSTRATGTAEDMYDDTHQRRLFDLELGWAVVESMRDSVTPLVLSYLDPLREQRSREGLHLCAHVRTGNNEFGRVSVWKKRQKDLNMMLNATLFAMERYAARRGGVSTDVTVFVASDVIGTKPWFSSHVPSGWSVVLPRKETPRPKEGHWFGQYRGSSAPNRSQLIDAMAEAVADLFALGECDALFIPNYSSFTTVSIMLTRSRRRDVFFMEEEGTEFHRYGESAGTV